MTNKTNIKEDNEGALCALTLISIIFGAFLPFLVHCIFNNEPILSIVIIIICAILFFLIHSAFSQLLKHINNAKNNP